jgi:hypothetical protein
MQNSQIFRASLLWMVNVAFGAAVGLVGVIILPAIFVFYFQDGVAPQIRVPLLAIFTLSALLLYLAYFPGNLGVFFPYKIRVGAVDIELSGLFKRTTIAVSDIGDIEDSIFWQGYVIHLLKPHAALTQFIVPWYFGS